MCFLIHIENAYGDLNEKFLLPDRSIERGASVLFRYDLIQNEFTLLTCFIEKQMHCKMSLYGVLDLSMARI